MKSVFKIVLIGDGGVGKTTFIKRYTTGKFEKVYEPTLGVDVFNLEFETNYGPIIFNVWDTAGQLKYGGLRDGYYIASDGAIIMYDATSESSLESVLTWAKNLSKVCKGIPLVLVKNKIDVKNKKEEWEDKISDLNISNISTKSDINCNEPFLFLAQELKNKNDLYFLK